MKASITNIRAKVENDWWVSVRKLSQNHDVLTQMVHGTHHKDLQLSKKLASSLTKNGLLINEECPKTKR
jgi:hypothetical protein